MKTDAPSNILVAEDNPFNAEILSKALQKAGYQVLVAKDGFQAVDMARAHLPDTILLDMMMPGRNGIETCEILKSYPETQDIPVLFVTAVSDSDLVVKAFQAGGCDYITKPFRIAEVLARVSTHVRLKISEQELGNKNKQTQELSKLLAETNVELALLTRIDPLTKIFNRRAWEEAATFEHRRFEQSGQPYSILIIDVDHFKVFNDLQGHQAGDDCLCRLVKAVVSACGPKDIVGRYGGEEFVVLASDTTRDMALQLGERVRRAIWDMAIPHSAGVGESRITASVGVATCESESWQKTLQNADDALYVAKRSGRNMLYAYHTLKPTGQQQSHAESHRSPPQDDADPNNRTTVLIVDDDPTNRTLCKGCLIREGYLVSEAEDGGAAISLIEENPPDVIIMDAVMPVMDGLQCTQHLKADPATRDIPIIMLSSHQRGSDFVAGLEAGADEYVSKPIHAKELALRVKSITSANRERKELIKSYQDRGEQTRALRMILDYSSRLGRVESRKEIFQLTLAIASELIGGRCISILLPDEQRECLIIAQSIGLEHGVEKTVRIPMEDTIVGQVWKTRETVVINNRDVEQSRFHGRNPQFLIDVPLVATPLAAADQTVGVLTIANRLNARPFDPAELEYIQLICNFAASSIHDLNAAQQRDVAYDSIVVAFAQLAEHRDNDTGKHLERVTRYSMILAHELSACERFRGRIDRQFLRSLERAVPLHDIGKVAIPDYILLKPGRLTPEEMEIMKTHTVIGAQVIQSVLKKAASVAFLRMAEKIALSHHECYDGSGYPTGLKGDVIPLSARIVCVSDVYDALTTKRVYKEAYSHDKATAIILEACGTQFDPLVVEAFVQHEKEFSMLSAKLSDEHHQPGTALRSAAKLAPSTLG